MTSDFDNPSTVFQTDRGKVLRCPCCDRLEVQFGNIAIAESTDAFPRLCRVITGLDLTRYAQTSSERPVVIPVDGDRVNLRFTLEEADELVDLMNGAQAMLDLETLIDETLNPTS